MQAYGHRYFKLKVGGQLAADLARLEAIAAVLDRRKEPYFVSLDGNEQYEDAQGVAELIAAIRSRPALRALVAFDPFHRAADRTQDGTGHRPAHGRRGASR